MPGINMSGRQSSEPLQLRGEVGWEIQITQSTTTTISIYFYFQQIYKDNLHNPRILTTTKIRSWYKVFGLFFARQSSIDYLLPKALFTLIPIILNGVFDPKTHRTFSVHTEMLLAH